MAINMTHYEKEWKIGVITEKKFRYLKEEETKTSTSAEKYCSNRDKGYILYVSIYSHHKDVFYN